MWFSLLQAYTPQHGKRLASVGNTDHATGAGRFCHAISIPGNVEYSQKLGRVNSTSDGGKYQHFGTFLQFS